MGATLARPLLLRWFVAMAFLSPLGCVLPDDTSPLLPMPNRPPFIIEQGATPQRHIHPSLCQPIKFSAPVEDWDLGDQVSASWFVDDVAVGLSKPTSLQSSTSPIRDTSQADLTVSPTDPDPNIKQLYSGSSTHIVEVVYCDGELHGSPPALFTTSALSPPLPDGGATPNRPLPDGGLYADIRYFTSYAWTVEVTSGACPP